MDRAEGISYANCNNYHSHSHMRLKSLDHWDAPLTDCVKKLVAL